ncbi:TPA: hypothetical protein DDZ86_03570 [Candidatus Dependentiae bacterium]|nr:MAG: hypothetical protein UW09_C0003G0066 [candidate division TM6 bacterium GW2011_GWF2_43_87]HBL98694.1 hypothetical protein [Candidatus Dependentiae bacterium]
MFKWIIGLACALAFSLQIHTLPLSSMRGFDTITEKDILHPMIGYCTAKEFVANIYEHGQPKHLLTILVKSLFHTPVPEESPHPTIVGFYPKRSFYSLGWLAALATQESITAELKAAKKDSRHKKTADYTSLLNFASYCSRLDNKTPTHTLFFETIAQLERFQKIQKKGCPTFHSSDKKTKTPLPLYSKHIPLYLLNAFAGAKAETKKDYIKFLQGFFDHCSAIQKKWFKTNNNPQSFATTEFEKLRYSYNDYKNLRDQTFKNPSTWDLLYLCTERFEPIEPITLIFKGPHSRNYTEGDCCETGIIAAIFLILSTELPHTFTTSFLPKKLQTAPLVLDIVKRFQDRDCNDNKLRNEQFFVFSDPLFKKGKGKLTYEYPEFFSLEASLPNILNGLNYIFGLDAKDFIELGSLLSSKKRQITFTENHHPNNTKLGAVVLIIKDSEKKCSKKISLEVKKTPNTNISHVYTCRNEPEENPLVREKSIANVLSSHNIKTETFPFSMVFYTPIPNTCNLFHILPKREINHLFRIFSGQNRVEQFAQRQLKMLINFDTLCHPVQDLEEDVIKIIVLNAKKFPYTNFIKGHSPEHLAKMVLKANLAELFLKQVDPEWIQQNMSCKLHNQWKNKETELLWLNVFIPPSYLFQLSKVLYENEASNEIIKLKKSVETVPDSSEGMPVITES